jgi:MoxR-like ATPase
MSTTPQTLREKFAALYQSLDSFLVERSEVLKGCLIAILARKHLFMIGPPGMAKSLATERVCSSITAGKYFELLMDKFTKPEDLFGPHMISKLKVDQYERNTAGMAPESHIIFLDEIWKATGSILNALLRLMDESRKFYNGAIRVQTPLISLFGASNELPEDSSLNALYDRFMLRYYVGDVVDDDNFKRAISRNGTSPHTVTLTISDLVAAQAEVDTVDITHAVDLLATLRAKLRQEGFQFSIRRWRESVRILQAHAWLDGRAKVDSDDLEILQNVLWEKPEDRNQITKIIVSLSNPDLRKALELMDKAQEVHGEALKQKGSTAAGAEANDKLKKLVAELEALKQDTRTKEIRDKVKNMQRQVLRECMGFDM